MSWEVFKEFTFEAAHSLPHLPPGHKCARPHGHSYHVTVYVRGEPTPPTLFVVDYADISAAWKPLHARLDHNNLNDILGPSTSENLAHWIYEHLRHDLPGLHRVTVKETATAGATYWEGNE